MSDTDSVHPSPQPDHTVAAVEAVLFAELEHRRAEVAVIDPRLTDDVDRLIGYISAGGKRLRPQFLCWGWLAATGADNAALPPSGVLGAAAALELIQACALIHDDIIDRSDTRRGQPSVHRSVEQLHHRLRWSGEAGHYGVSAALLLGDLSLAWADDLFTAALADLGFPAGAQAAWRAMRTEVLSGQLLDLRISADESPDPVVAAADAMVVNRFKTAAYTVERPLHLGAALGGAGPGTIAVLRRYGSAIGLGFQLRDDLLGVFGDPVVTGKPAGDDLVEGKKTVLLAMARAALREQPDLLRELDAGVGTRLRPDRLDRLTGLISGTSAPVAIEAQITELFAAAMAALDARDDDGRALLTPIVAQNLRGLALAATTRNR